MLKVWCDGIGVCGRRCRTLKLLLGLLVLLTNSMRWETKEGCLALEIIINVDWCRHGIGGHLSLRGQNPSIRTVKYCAMFGLPR